jgi:hypothetical protein
MKISDVNGTDEKFKLPNVFTPTMTNTMIISLWTELILPQKEQT